MTPLDARHVQVHASHEVADLEALLPVRRGFWTDEELLADSGLGSVAVLRKLCGSRWLAADHGPLPEGGRRRVWTFGEVVRANVVAEIASRSSIPLLAVGMLLSRATATWVDEAISLKERIDAVIEGRIASPRSQRSRIIMLDGREAWGETAPGIFELISSGMSLNGAGMDVPRIARSHPEMRLEALFRRGMSIHVLDLASLDLGVFGLVRERLSIDP